MKKSLLTVLLLAAAAVSFESNAKNMKMMDMKMMDMKDMPNGMTPSQADMCRKACMMKGWKWDPTSQASKKGCTCVSGNEGQFFTITDADMEQMNLDNQVTKTKK